MAKINWAGMIASGAKAASAAIDKDIEQQRQMRLLELEQRFRTSEREAGQTFQVGQQRELFGQQTQLQEGRQKFESEQGGIERTFKGEESEKDRANRLATTGMSVSESRRAHMADESLESKKFEYEKEKPTSERAFSPAQSISAATRAIYGIDKKLEDFSLTDEQRSKLEKERQFWVDERASHAKGGGTKTQQPTMPEKPAGMGASPLSSKSNAILDELLKSSDKKPTETSGAPETDKNFKRLYDSYIKQGMNSKAAYDKAVAVSAQMKQGV